MVRAAVTKEHRQFRVLVSHDEDGYYVAECPALRGCFTQGRTLAEALKNIKLVEAAREEARLMIAADPELRNHPALAARTRASGKEMHLE